MRSVAGVGHLCTAYTSPYGPPAYGVVYGRIITGAEGIYANGRVVANTNSAIYYAGWVLINNNPTWVTWIGQVITGAPPQVQGQPIGVLGSYTNYLGQVVEGVGGIYAG